MPNKVPFVNRAFAGEVFLWFDSQIGNRIEVRKLRKVNIRKGHTDPTALRQLKKNPIFASIYLLYLIDPTKEPK